MAGIIEYIKEARASGMSDADIKNNLLAAGWDKTQVDAGLKAKGDLPVPPPPATAGASSGQVTVTSAFSTKGLEYFIMFVSMGISALALGGILHSIVDQLFSTSGFYEDVVSFAAATMVVSLPIYAVLFLRLKRAELKDPSVRLNPGRKRSIQLTLFVTFMIGIGRIIGYVYGLLNPTPEYGAKVDPAADLVHALVTIAIAGGIFLYYWIDIHKKEQ